MLYRHLATHTWIRGEWKAPAIGFGNQQRSSDAADRRRLHTRLAAAAAAVFDHASYVQFITAENVPAETLRRA